MRLSVSPTFSQTAAADSTGPMAGADRGIVGEVTFRLPHPMGPRVSPVSPKLIFHKGPQAQVAGTPSRPGRGLVTGA